MKKIKNIFVCLVALIVTVCAVSCSASGPKITIINFVNATALNNAENGIIAGLKEGGYENGVNCKISIVNVNTKADTLTQAVTNAYRTADLIFAIATPVAQELKAQGEAKGYTTPVLFTAVTDAVAAGIVPSNTAPGGHISGTTDLNDVDGQIKSFKESCKDASKIGFIYTSTEDNSVIQLNLAKTAAQEIGVELVEAPVTSSDAIDTAIDTLIAKGVQAIYVPTDNAVAERMQSVAAKCDAAGVVTICAEEGEVYDGGTYSLASVNYFELGKMTGAMGVRVLKGEDVGTMDVKGYKSTDLIFNPASVTACQANLLQAFLDKDHTTTDSAK